MKGHQREVVVVVARGKSKGPSEKDGCGRRKDSAEDTTRTRTREKRQTKDRRMLLVIFSLRIKNHDCIFFPTCQRVCEILDDICTRFVTYMCIIFYLKTCTLYVFEHENSFGVFMYTYLINIIYIEGIYIFMIIYFCDIEGNRTGVVDESGSARSRGCHQKSPNP